MSDAKRKMYRQLLADLEALNSSEKKRRPPLFLLSDDTWAPPTDILETPDELIVVMEIAGVQPEALEVHYSGGFLLVEGTRHELEWMQQAEIVQFHKKEIDFGRFRVKIKITTRIFCDRIQASYEGGFLTIHLPKDNTGRKTKDVTIKVDEVKGE